MTSTPVVVDVIHQAAIETSLSVFKRTIAESDRSLLARCIGEEAQRFCSRVYHCGDYSAQTTLLAVTHAAQLRAHNKNSVTLTFEFVTRFAAPRITVRDLRIALETDTSSPPPPESSSPNHVKWSLVGSSISVEGNGHVFRWKAQGEVSDADAEATIVEKQRADELAAQREIEPEEAEEARLEERRRKFAAELEADEREAAEEALEELEARIEDEVVQARAVSSFVTPALRTRRKKRPHTAAAEPIESIKIHRRASKRAAIERDRERTANGRARKSLLGRMVPATVDRVGKWLYAKFVAGELNPVNASAPTYVLTYENDPSLFMN